MNRYQRKSYIFILSLFFLFPLKQIRSDGIKIFESAQSEEKTKESIERILGNMDERRFKKLDETLGFSYLYRSRWISPFTYAIYIGPIKSDSDRTVVRIEGSRGDAKMLERILAQEGLKKDYVQPEKLRELNHKSHILAQGMNIYAPWAAMLYSGYHSPRMTGKETFKKFLFYFIADVFFIYAGGTNWFQDHFDLNAYRGNIAAGLFLARAIGAVQTMNLTRGHNRVFELKYTFPYK